MVKLAVLLSLMQGKTLTHTNSDITALSVQLAVDPKGSSQLRCYLAARLRSPSISTAAHSLSGPHFRTTANPAGKGKVYEGELIWQTMSC